MGSASVSESEKEIGELRSSSSRVRYVYFRTNTLEKDINPHLPSYGLNSLGSLALRWQPAEEKENS